MLTSKPQAGFLYARSTALQQTPAEWSIPEIASRITLVGWIAISVASLILLGVIFYFFTIDELELTIPPKVKLKRRIRQDKEIKQPLASLAGGVPQPAPLLTPTDVPPVLAVNKPSPGPPLINTDPMPNKRASNKPRQALKTESLQRLIDFAYASSGLDLSREEARSWAMDRIGDFEDVDVEAFINRFQGLRDFAYASSGLDMSRSEARAWALNRTRDFKNVDIGAFVKRFDELRDFAYASSGLNKSGSEARAWALEHVSSEYEVSI